VSYDTLLAGGAKTVFPLQAVHAASLRAEFTTAEKRRDATHGQSIIAGHWLERKLPWQPDGVIGRQRNDRSVVEF